MFIVCKTFVANCGHYLILFYDRKITLTIQNITIEPKNVGHFQRQFPAPVQRLKTEVNFSLNKEFKTYQQQTICLFQYTPTVRKTYVDQGTDDEINTHEDREPWIIALLLLLLLLLMMIMMMARNKLLSL